MPEADVLRHGPTHRHADDVGRLIEVRRNVVGHRLDGQLPWGPFTPTMPEQVVAHGAVQQLRVQELPTFPVHPNGVEKQQGHDPSSSWSWTRLWMLRPTV